jgi:TPR repeat protein
MPQRVNHLLTALVKHQREGCGGGPGRRETIMEWTQIEHFAKIRPADTTAADLYVARCLAAAAAGEVDACYDLGIVYSTGSHGVGADLIEAHKWFNLAAANGHEAAAWCRADVSDEMTAREIAEAQRRAREWLAAEARRAA